MVCVWEEKRFCRWRAVVVLMPQTVHLKMVKMGNFR